MITFIRTRNSGSYCGHIFRLLPYCIQTISKQTDIGMRHEKNSPVYIILDRDYNMIGGLWRFSRKINTRDLSHMTVNPDEYNPECWYFYKDGSSPWLNFKNRQSYMKRLSWFDDKLGIWEVVKPGTFNSEEIE